MEEDRGRSAARPFPAEEYDTMAVRVGGGQVRGRVLKVARGSAARPSSGRVRSALFSMLDSRVTGALRGVRPRPLRRLTGPARRKSSASKPSAGAPHVAITLTSWSRAALSAHLHELRRDTFSNLEIPSALPRQARVHRMTVEPSPREGAHPEACRRAALSKARPYDLVLMDPPYAQDDLIADSRRRRARKGWRWSRWCTERRSPLLRRYNCRRARPSPRPRSPPTAGGLERVTERTYGDTVLTIYRRSGGAQ